MARAIRAGARIMRARRAAACAALLAAACGGGTDTVPVGVRLTVDQATCGPMTPAELPLGYLCGGEIGLRALDAASGEVLDELCVTFTPDEGFSLADVPTILDAAGASFAALPAGVEVTFEIDVYTPSPGGFEPCQRYDPTGVEPLVAYPAYHGSSAPVRLAGDPDIELPVGCVMWPYSCEESPQVTTIQATVTAAGDPGAQILDPEMDVRVGAIADLGGTWSFTTYAELTYAAGSGLWEATTDGGFLFPPECVGSLVTRVGAGPAVSTLSCDGYYDGLVGWAEARHLDPAVLTAITTAIGTTDIAGEGLVVGRVLDGSSLPLAGATVSGSGLWADLRPHVLYLSDDLTTASDTGGTSTSGWFVVDTATTSCCDYFSAEAVLPEDGLLHGGTSAAAVGLVAGVVSVTHIHVY